jgi:phosphate starvation-inducible PhoH-like protein
VLAAPSERGWRPRSSEPGRRDAAPIVIRSKPVEARGPNQRRYMDAIAESTLTFGIGASGTGKTYLAVAAAVKRLRAGDVKRLVITRPVVEAGEHLGFLPGDLQAKLNPYMRPIYDALYDIIGVEESNRLEDAGVIEVAPLAYMRGRTLAQSFVILDEAQNTTVGQMRMFLTRLGEGSRMVVTGDPTQSDLEPGRPSGFMDAVRRLRGFVGVAVVEFDHRDIVRHPLVEQIVRAYESAQPRTEERREGE